MDGRYHCELAWLGGDAAAAGVVLDVAGGVITSVTTGVAEPPAGAVRLAGLTLPGLANAHSHAFHRALRGRTQFEQGTGTGSFWTWREQMYGVAEALTPESYLALARAVYGSRTRNTSSADAARRGRRSRCGAATPPPASSGRDPSRDWSPAADRADYRQRVRVWPCRPRPARRAGCRRRRSARSDIR